MKKFSRKQLLVYSADPQTSADEVRSRAGFDANPGALLMSICISSERGRVFTGKLRSLVPLLPYSGNAYWPSTWK